MNFAVLVKLICVFVSAYAKRWFSHDAAQLSSIMGAILETILESDYLAH